jgi:DNA-binding NtrC family response regulator
MRVMVLSSDRRFRQVVSLLLERRGCAVSVGQGRGTLAERVDRERTDVVVIDACRSLAAAARMRAAVDALSRPVGVVIVGEEDQSELLELQEIVAKWGPFEQLFEAVERSYRERVGGPALFGHERERVDSEPLKA